MSISVKLENVTKKFKTPDGGATVAVDNLSLAVETGKFVTLLGPSGCGKTTTLRMIAGFELPNSGRVYLDDNDVTYTPPNKRGLAMVFQSYALFPHLTVAGNVAYSLRIKKINEKEIKEKVKTVLEMVGLSGMENRYPNQLSGGQQQRVALARAIVLHPKVLLFDEPLSNLDAKLREEMRERIRELQQHLRITAIYVTHDQTEAMTMSDVIVVINHGKIEQIGAPAEIYERPANKFVADFIGRVNLLNAKLLKIESRKLKLELMGKIVSAASFSGAGSAMALAIRPEAVEIYQEPLTEKTVFPGKVVKTIYLGQHVEYAIKLESGPEITAITLGRALDARPGDTVYAYFKPEAIHGVLA